MKQSITMTEIRTINVKPAASEGLYRVYEFRCSPTMGWIARLETPGGEMIVSSDVDYILTRLIESQYPVSLVNLNFLLAKAGYPAISAGFLIPSDITEETETNKRTWAENMLDTLKDMKRHLPNMSLHSATLGKDFLVIRVNSKKQAKKVIKGQIFKGVRQYIERRGTSIMLREVPNAK